MRRLSVEGLSLCVSERGEGHPLLLINGIGAHTGMWRPLERALTDVRLISFDAPGTGASETPRLPLALDALADVAEAVVDRLGYERVDVLGYSFGGLVAQRLARSAPQRVRRLVLAATTPGWGGVPGSLTTLMRMSTPLRYYWREYYESVVGELMGGRARTDQEFVRRQGALRRTRPPDPVGYAWQLAALAFDAGSLGWLHTLEPPTLVVTGDDDPVMPLANSVLLAHAIGKARLLVAPGEGHLLLVDPDSAALPAIHGFLTSDPPDWGDAVEVTRGMVDAALGAEPPRHPYALMSAFVRTFWDGFT